MLNMAQLRISTKTLISGFASFGALMQVPQISQFVLKHTTDHPRLCAIATSAGGIYLLLHNPQVEAALGIKRTVTTETVSIPPETPHEP